MDAFNIVDWVNDLLMGSKDAFDRTFLSVHAKRVPVLALGCSTLDLIILLA
jgi:hypothetical protein